MRGGEAIVYLTQISPTMSEDIANADVPEIEPIILEGVRGGEWDLGFPVCICRDKRDTGRIVVRGVNEAGFACVDIDRLDLLNWLAHRAPNSVDVDAVYNAIIIGSHSERH